LLVIVLLGFLIGPDSRLFQTRGGDKAHRDGAGIHVVFAVEGEQQAGL
jgi:hypothetical protein